MYPLLPVVAISVGASVGALARWGLALWLNPLASMPLGTLAANLVGGYLIGICMALPQLDPVWRLAIVTGFLGGLTTFSSFSAEVVNLLQQARYVLAFGTAMLHVAGSLRLTIAGYHTATLLWPTPLR